MKQLKKIASLSTFFLAGLFFISTNAVADGGHHGHWGGGGGGYRGNYYGHGYYGRGYYGGPGYYPGVGPNIIIGVPLAPPPPYYRRHCETVEICNQFDECWLERHCN